MENQLRISIREAATEITGSEADKIAGAMNTTVDNENGCYFDHSTDCWVRGGAMVYNDDASF